MIHPERYPTIHGSESRQNHRSPMPKTRILIKKRKQTVQYYTEQLVDGVGLDMALIPAGQFWMGLPVGELEQDLDGELEQDLVNELVDELEQHLEQEGPQHLVTMPEFFMGRYPITQGQWKAVVENTEPIAKDLNPEPSHFSNGYDRGIGGMASDINEDIEIARQQKNLRKQLVHTKYKWNRPVEQVDWYDAIEFCARLSKLTNRQYRLPSEAEWEYACRGVSVTGEQLLTIGGELTKEIWNQKFCQPFHFGVTISTDLANYNGTDGPYGKRKGNYGRGVTGEYRKQTTPVGHFKIANTFGLSDMHGNVLEWCADPWHENYKEVPDDGSVWDSDGNHQYYNLIENVKSLLKSQQDRVVRGGAWSDSPKDCRSASRFKGYAGGALNDQGFRVCRSRPDS